MKTGWLVKAVIGVAGLATLGIPRAYAQAEIDPDHFEMTNVEPLRTAPANAQIQANQALEIGCVNAVERVRCSEAKTKLPSEKQVSLVTAGSAIPNRPTADAWELAAKTKETERKQQMSIRRLINETARSVAL